MFEKSGKKSVPFIDVEGIYVPGSNKKMMQRAVEQRRGIELY